MRYTGGGQKKWPLDKMVKIRHNVWESKKYVKGYAFLGCVQQDLLKYLKL